MDHGYEDIITCSRPRDPHRCRMSNADRAAQFSPFAALTGFDDVIRETGRLTEGRIELEENRWEELNAILRSLLERVARQPWVAVTHFVPDRRKEGGAYRRTEGHVKRIDSLEGVLVLTDRTVIPLRDIVSIEE